MAPPPAPCASRSRTYALPRGAGGWAPLLSQALTPASWPQPIEPGRTLDPGWSGHANASSRELGIGCETRTYFLLVILKQKYANLTSMGQPHLALCSPSQPKLV